MTGLVRKATLFGVCAVLAASTALANVPDLTNSRWFDWQTPAGRSTSQPIFIDVVNKNVTIDTFSSQMTLRLLDFANNPVSGAAVEIDFDANPGGACDFRLCDQNGGALAGNVFSATSNASGDVIFRLAGGANGNAFTPANAQTSKGATVVIRVNNNVFANAIPVAWDQNAVIGPGTNASDISFIVVAGSFNAAYWSRADLNHTGTATNINAADISFYLARNNKASSGCVLNAAPVCP
jgi:hypothetical protein